MSAEVDWQEIFKKLLAIAKEELESEQGRVSERVQEEAKA